MESELNFLETVQKFKRLFLKKDFSFSKEVQKPREESV